MQFINPLNKDHPCTKTVLVAIGVVVIEREDCSYNPSVQMIFICQVQSPRGMSTVLFENELELKEWTGIAI